MSNFSEYKIIKVICIVLFNLDKGDYYGYKRH